LKQVYAVLTIIAVVGTYMLLLAMYAVTGAICCYYQCMLLLAI